MRACVAVRVRMSIGEPDQHGAVIRAHKRWISCRIAMATDLHTRNSVLQIRRHQAVIDPHAFVLIPAPCNDSRHRGASHDTKRSMFAKHTTSATVQTPSVHAILSETSRDTHDTLLTLKGSSRQALVYHAM